MCVYFLKAKDKTSEAMKQTAKARLVENKSGYDQMKSGI